jgi:hypothetical protein
MPKKQKAPPEADDTLLVSAAKAIGTAAGKIASLTGAASEHPAKSTKKGKLPKKNKRRLPRLQKKAQRKAEASQSS